ncbi:MAG: sigma-54-dependent Fis family transcriptional regulator, partial [Acidobacteria bacterium]|nr:sigma-54-dependent Fis family transcriptional regulator [Acidobacteriota bacterium]
YPWPGNVRELEALCERWTVFGAGPVTPADLPASFLRAAAEATPHCEPFLPLKEYRARAEKAYIEKVLEETGWNVSAAARILGVQRSHLHQKLTALGTRRPGQD